ncbi:hypothetical protein [Fructobacillus cardui]|uniref:hypothetical protein n=1 Tax=Fructobacillus cardui TaxID=2893170 RepID=UPI0030C85E8B
MAPMAIFLVPTLEKIAFLVPVVNVTGMVVCRCTGHIANCFKQNFTSNVIASFGYKVKILILPGIIKPYTGFRYYMGTYYWFVNGVRQNEGWRQD